VRHIDAGRIEFDDGRLHFFINIADCGMGGEVVARVVVPSSSTTLAVGEGAVWVAVPQGG
jgi:diacylglycerol kinase family enzyme